MSVFFIPFFPLPFSFFFSFLFNFFSLLSPSSRCIDAAIPSRQRSAMTTTTAPTSSTSRSPRASSLLFPFPFLSSKYFIKVHQHRGQQHHRDDDLLRQLQQPRRVPLRARQKHLPSSFLPSLLFPFSFLFSNYFIKVHQHRGQQHYQGDNLL
jgi:hypothetical protein